MNQKCIYFSLILILVGLLWCCAGFFVVSGSVFADDEPTETPTVTTYTIQYLDNNTPLLEPDTNVFVFPHELKTITETKEGYTFNGWYFTNTEGGYLVPDEQEKFWLTEAQAQKYAVVVDGVNEVKIFASWKLDEFTLTYIYTGIEYGSAVSATGFENLNNKVTVSTTLDLSKSEYQPRCAGHQFVGWFSDSECTKELKTLENVTSNMTLYGKFKELDYRVSFDESLKIESIRFRSGIDYAYDYTDSIGVKHEGKLTGIIPVKEGYTFSGWYTTADCKEGTRVGKFYIFSTPVTLYAKWTKTPSPIWLYASLGACVLIAGGFAWWYFANKRKFTN